MGLELLVGVDVVDIARFRRFERDTPMGQLQTLYTDAEMNAVSARKDPVPGLAVRFAAKEAVVKALGDLAGYPLDWRAIEVVSAAGVPSIRMHGEVAEAARSGGVRQMRLSLSHSETTAVAQGVGFRLLRFGDPQLVAIDSELAHDSD